MAKAKSNGAKVMDAMTASGMMPEDVASKVNVAGDILKKAGVAGTIAKMGLPGILLLAVFLPTIFAPFSMAISIGIYAFIGYAVLKKTGHLPSAAAATSDKDAIDARRQQAMRGAQKTDMTRS